MAQHALRSGGGLHRERDVHPLDLGPTRIRCENVLNEIGTYPADIMNVVPQIPEHSWALSGSVHAYIWARLLPLGIALLGVAELSAGTLPAGRQPSSASPTRCSTGRIASMDLKVTRVRTMRKRFCARDGWGTL